MKFKNGPIKLKFGAQVKFGVQIMKIKLKITNYENLVLWDRDVIKKSKMVQSS